MVVEVTYPCQMIKGEEEATMTYSNSIVLDQVIVTFTVSNGYSMLAMSRETAIAHARQVMRQVELLQEGGGDEEMPDSLAKKRAFMKLPLEERRRIMAEQAEKLLPHYSELADGDELL